MLHYHIENTQTNNWLVPFQIMENLWKCFNMIWVSSEQRGKYALFSKVFKTVFTICKELHYVRVNTEDFFCQNVSFYLRVSLGKCYLASSFNQIICNEWLQLTIFYAFVGSAATDITGFCNFTFLSNKSLTSVVGSCARIIFTICSICLLLHLTIHHKQLRNISCTSYIKPHGNYCYLGWSIQNHFSTLSENLKLFLFRLHYLASWKCVTTIVMVRIQVQMQRDQLKLNRLNVRL